MKCVACGKKIMSEFSSSGIAISFDGDFVCDQKCKDLFNRQLGYLCSEIFPSVDRTTNFVFGLEDYPVDL